GACPHFGRNAQRPDGEMDIIPRFEREVAGSTPARGAHLIPSSSGQDVPLTWERAVVRVHPGSLDCGLAIANCGFERWISSLRSSQSEIRNLRMGPVV